MIAVIDYGMGNLRSVQKALEHVGAQANITQKQEDILRAEKIVLPGVGAMLPAMRKLQDLQLIETIKLSVSQKKPFLGICLGYQLMFEKSNEGGDVPGLGLLKGDVVRFSAQQKIPQMGWNTLHITKAECPLYQNIEQEAFVYFCHSYFVRPHKDVVASTTDYQESFSSSVWHDNLFGVQFHPEKSQHIGLTLLKNFAAL